MSEEREEAGASAEKRAVVGDDEIVDDEIVEAEVVADAATAADDLELLRAERDAFLDDLQRLQAEYANYRKRMLREQTAQIERATEALIEQLLPVLDSFQLALVNLDLPRGDEAAKVRKGVELVYAELLGVLEKAGLERIDAEGKPFDPTEHEAVMQEDGDGEPVVIDIMRTGYRLKGRVLRPAMVRVAR
jgi:molecular chaperone GrpE